MKPPNGKVDGRVRIFNNALKSIKSLEAPSKKTSITSENNIIQAKVMPANHLPVTQENMHNICSSEDFNEMEISENEYGFLPNEVDECAASLPDNQLNMCSWLNNNNLDAAATVHSNAKNVWDLWMEESQLCILKELGNDSFEQVVDECSPPLLNDQLNVFPCVSNSPLKLNQQNLYTNVKNVSDLWIKEKRFSSFQQLRNDSFDQVVEESSLVFQNNQMDMVYFVENNHLTAIQETLFMDVNNKPELRGKENQLEALQQLGNGSSFQVVDECSPSFQNNSSDLCSWVENSRLASIQETLHMDINNETDLWLKQNRLRALQQLENVPLEEYTSDATLISPYCMNSVGEISPDLTRNPSDYQSVNVLPPSAENSISSSEENSSNILNASYRNDNFIMKEKHLMHEELKVQSTERKNFSYDCKFSSRYSQFLDQEKATAYKDVESVCENIIEFANLSEHESCLVKEETQSSGQHFAVSEPENCGCNKIENISCNLLQEKWKKRMVRNKNNVAKLPSYDADILMTLKSTTGFFDAHCHLDFLLNRQGFHGTYADYMAQHKNSYPESYKGCIAVFCKPFTFSKKNIWQKHLEQDNVWGAFGCHPKEAQNYNEQIEEDLKAALDHHKVKALGEIGLDYSEGNRCPRDVQQNVFKRQLKIASERKLRLVIHCRDADDDTIKIMLEVFPKDTIFHLHCFTGDWVTAQKWINEFPNVFIGITNLVTFPSATPTHEVVRKLPLEHLLLETDAPYFVPRMAPKGTRYSHPGMAIHVAAQVAALQNIPIEKVLQWTSSNTKVVYDIQ
ncbi:putative deoxyribonuclease TATDN2 like protein [Argiope bruennichi]|uniref:Putative deoxyribonuclease TATDN2 like protein n=1 Tax=Argiope bruennichi TaxID=94029 RepID=A0A8T0E5L8_ARGBR|nr:putative deoxyribonuclease TATDN2 like protein [Argiope bruennichi]